MTGEKPILTFITGHLTPYTTHLIRLIAAGIPEMRVRTLVTKNASTMWKSRQVPEIGTVLIDETTRDWSAAPWPAHVRHEWSKAREVKRWLAENRPAAVIAAGYDEIPNMMAARWCRGNRVPVFVSGDSNMASDTSRGLKRLVKRLVVPRLVRRFDGVLVCGRRGKEFFTYYGADPSRIYFMPLVPNYEQIEAITPEQIEGVRAKHGLAPERRRLILCQRLIPLKRTDLVVQAFAAIGGERPEWDVVIIGDGPERGRVEAMVPAALRERVRFLGFIGDMTEIGCLYRCSDALVLASMHEAWALVILEAMAAGLAIAGTDVIGAVPEMVHEGVNGAVFPPGDLDALTSALRRVTAPEAIDRLKGESRRVMREWRREADPVQGVRKALREAGALGGDQAVRPPANVPASVSKP